jgi:hypothetical protein
MISGKFVCSNGIRWTLFRTSGLCRQGQEVGHKDHGDDVER